LKLVEIFKKSSGISGVQDTADAASAASAKPSILHRQCVRHHCTATKFFKIWSDIITVLQTIAPSRTDFSDAASAVSQTDSSDAAVSQTDSSDAASVVSQTDSSDAASVVSQTDSSDAAVSQIALVK
jgi:hypothetical protein